MKTLAEVTGVRPGASLQEIQAAMEAKAQEAPETNGDEPKCRLCQKFSLGNRYCLDCEQVMHRARSFRNEHCFIPLRYKGAEGLDDRMRLGGSYLLTGLPGRGKTWLAY